VLLLSSAVLLSQITVMESLSSEKPRVWAGGTAAYAHSGLEKQEEVLARVRRRIRAAKARRGKTWEQLFQECDRDHSGTLDWSELNGKVRSVLGIPTQTVCDYELRILFNEIDKDRSSSISIAELLEYVDRGPKRPEDEALKFNQRMQRTRKNLQMAAMKLSTIDADIRKLFKKLDMDGSNKLSFFEFEYFVRKDLKLTNWDVKGADIEHFYDFLDRDNDGIEVEELMGYIQRKDREQDRSQLGAQAFYVKPAAPQISRKRRTYRQEILETSQRHMSRSASAPSGRLSSSYGFSCLGREHRSTSRMS